MTTVAAKGQTEDKITPDESRRALVLAHRFAEDLLKHKDYAPLLSKYFISGFEKKLSKGATPLLVDEIRRTPHVRQGLKRFYIAQNNFVLLTFLYQVSRPDAVKVDSEDDRAMLPADVREVVDRQSDLWKKLTSDGKFGPLTVVESNRYFDKSVGLLEMVNNRLRKHVVKLTPQSPKIKDFLKPQSMNGYKTFDTWVYTCDIRCYLDIPFPKGTRLVIVEMPFLQQMVLVSYGNKFRIVAVYLSD